jgi:hypothetical protein
MCKCGFATTAYPSAAKQRISILEHDRQLELNGQNGARGICSGRLGARSSTGSQRLTSVMFASRLSPCNLADWKAGRAFVRGHRRFCNAIAMSNCPLSGSICEPADTSTARCDDRAGSALRKCLAQASKPLHKPVGVAHARASTSIYPLEAESSQPNPNLAPR